MGLLTGLGKLFGVKSGKDVKINKDDLRFLADLFNDTNRTDTEGLFGGWAWDGDRQVQSVNPAMQGGLDIFYDRINTRPGANPNAGQFDALVDATMAQKMVGGPDRRRPPERPRPAFERPEFDGPPPDVLEELRRRRYG